MFNEVKDDGYTVQELLDKLKYFVESGMGSRRILIGPVDGDDGTKSVASPVVGLEATTDPDSSELGILWLYPGNNEWL